MRTLLLLISLFSLSAVSGQFQIGQTTITFNDPSRTGGFGSGGGPGRQIQTEVYYPAEAAGTDVTVASGTFPVVVIGHGFVMSWDAYQNYWELLVPMGYIVALPRTEGGITPSHNDFGLDIALVADRLRELSTESGALFEGRVSNQAAVGGHSMGGGAAVIALAANSNLQAYFGLASAETNPSAVSAASQASTPALMFAGSADDVTPPAQHQTPIYNALAADCKAYVTLTGGGHCNFANESGTCELGELFTSGNITLSRDEQQALTYAFLVPWLDFWLKGAVSAMDDFMAALNETPNVTHTISCANPVGISENNQGTPSYIYPNPATDSFTVVGSYSPSARYLIYDLNGKQLDEGRLNPESHRISCTAYSPGAYMVVIVDGDTKAAFRLLRTAQ